LKRRRFALEHDAEIATAAARIEAGAGFQMQDFLGGSPLSILVKLVFLSLLVGALLAFLDVTPYDLVNRVLRMLRSIFGMSFDAVRDIGRWILFGAMIVVPIWLVVRLFKSAR
jgi:Family of unknown function (DUF6460)